MISPCPGLLHIRPYHRLDTNNRNTRSLFVLILDGLQLPLVHGLHDAWNYTYPHLGAKELIGGFPVGRGTSPMDRIVQVVRREPTVIILGVTYCTGGCVVSIRLAFWAQPATSWRAKTCKTSQQAFFSRVSLRAGASFPHFTSAWVTSLSWCKLDAPTIHDHSIRSYPSNVSKATNNVSKVM